MKLRPEGYPTVRLTRPSFLTVAKLCDLFLFQDEHRDALTTIESGWVLVSPAQGCSVRGLRYRTCQNGPVKNVPSRILQQRIAELFRAWGIEPIDINVVVNPRLRRSLGRSRPTDRVIELRPDVLTGPKKRLFETLCHEAAHIAVFQRVNRARPHGPEWRHLVSSVGCNPRVAKACRVPSSNPPAARNATGRQYAKANQATEVFDHSCPVCHMVRTAKRPVRFWRCASCVQVGLPGTLLIEKRESGKTHE